MITRECELGDSVSAPGLVPSVSAPGLVPSVSAHERDNSVSEAKPEDADGVKGGRVKFIKGDGFEIPLEETVEIDEEEIVQLYFALIN